MVAGRKDKIKNAQTDCEINIYWRLNFTLYFQWNRKSYKWKFTDVYYFYPLIKNKILLVGLNLAFKTTHLILYYQFFNKTPVSMYTFRGHHISLLTVKVLIQIYNQPYNVSSTDTNIQSTMQCLKYWYKYTINHKMFSININTQILFK